MKDVFDSYVENTFDGFEQASFKFKQFENNYKKYFPAERNAKILDIGIGRGEMLTCMKQWGYFNYLGIDISPSTVNFCKSLDLECTIVSDTSEWLLEHKGSFTLITLLDVLEHIKKEYTISFIRAIREALKEGGILIVQVPNMQSPDSQLHRYNDFTHETGYIEHSLSQVLLTAGFESIEINRFHDHVSEHWSKFLWKGLRYIYWKYVRFTRKISGNLNPEILSPVFYAKVSK